MIQLDHVQKIAGGTSVLDVAALAVRAGEIVAVVGPPNSGQAELLALLAGQAQPTAGTLRIGGVDPTRERERLGQVAGVLLAENGLYERLSARANLAFYCRVRGLPVARADEVLRLVGLVDHAAVPAGRLSPGLARRLAFGRTLLHRPSVLILADPLADCDAASADLLIRLIRDAGSQGTAVLILASSAEGLAGLCQALYGIERGRVMPLPVATEGRADDLPFRIPARQEGQVSLINPADVLYASAESGRTCLVTAAGPVPTHLTLADLEPRLARRGFFRAHRGYLVNLQHVKAVVPYTRDSFTLVLDDPPGTEIPLSKTAARELRELLDY